MRNKKCREILTRELATQLYVIEKKTSKEISLQLNMATSTIAAILSEYGIKKHYKYYNPIVNYFDNWNNKVAYILGMLMADGCVINPKRGETTLCIKSIDLDLIEFIRNEISPNRPISKYIRQNKNAIGIYYNLMIPSDIICNKLLSYNIFPRKTNREILPEIPLEYKGDYLRGLFDGDGCIYVHTNFKNIKKGRINIVSSSEVFINSVKIELCQNMGNIYSVIKKGYTNPLYSLYIQSLSGVKMMYNIMYLNKDNSFYLKRKHQKFLEVLENNK